MEAASLLVKCCLTWPRVERSFTTRLVCETFGLCINNWQFVFIIIYRNFKP